MVIICGESPFLHKLTQLIQGRQKWKVKTNLYLEEIAGRSGYLDFFCFHLLSFGFFHKFALLLFSKTRFME